MEAHVTYKEQSQQQVKLSRTTATKDAEVIAEVRIVRQSSPAMFKLNTFCSQPDLSLHNLTRQTQALYRVCSPEHFMWRSRPLLACSAAQKKTRQRRKYKLNEGHKTSTIQSYGACDILTDHLGNSTTAWSLQTLFLVPVPPFRS